MPTPAGGLVYEDLPLPLRVLRDSSSPDIARVRVDSEATFAKLKEFAEHFVPRLAPLIELYTESRPIFDVYGIDDEIDRALHRKVPLKSGGHVVFDQTEAMTTIDVNTGAYVGHRNLEETIFRTNLEAAAAIARQLRCAIWAVSSSSTSSTWPRKSIAARCSRRSRTGWPAITPRATS